MDNLLQDVRYGFRSLRQNPGFFALASFSLALGIAVNVTIFAGVDLLLLRPVSYPNLDRVVQVWSDNRERGWARMGTSVPDFLDWRSASRSGRLAAYAASDFNLSQGDRPERVNGYRVSSGFFEILGVTPALGRLFRPEEEEPGRGRVAILTERLWRDHFGADSQVVGRELRLDGDSYLVVGVLPAGFRFDRATVYAPLEAATGAGRGDRHLRMLGLLAPGATVGRLQNELTGLTGELALRYPESNAGVGARVRKLMDEIVPPSTRQGGTISLIAVLFVLLIACSNVANLLLARGTSRGRELALRSALGASRTRLLRQLLTESLILAGVGGILGVGMSFFGVRWLGTIIPADVPGIDNLGLDGRVLGYAFLVMVAAGVAAGIAPSLQVTRGTIIDPLKDGGRGTSSGLRHGRLRAGLVVTQVSLALVLVISAGLLIKGTLRMQSASLGFTPQGVLTFALTLTAPEYPDTAAASAFQDELLARLRRLPGVTGAAAVSRLPMTGGSSTSYQVAGEPILDEARRPVAQYRSVTPGFFPVLEVGMNRGRDFAPADRLGSPGYVLVNETLAQRHWPGRDPVGRRLGFAFGEYEIAGVVKDLREFGPDEPPPALVYFSAAQRYSRTLHFLLRTAGDPAALAPQAREEVASAAPGLPPYAIRTLDRVVDDELQGNRIMPRLLGAFGVIALFLAMVGVYSVTAFSISQRTQEMGIRRALGAGSSQILGLVLRQGALLSGLGVAVGLALSAAVTSTLRIFLFGVSAFDPAVFLGATFALSGTLVAAGLVPARRATRVSPLVAMRSD